MESSTQQLFRSSVFYNEIRSIEIEVKIYSVKEYRENTQSDLAALCTI